MSKSEWIHLPKNSKSNTPRFGSAIQVLTSDKAIILNHKSLLITIPKNDIAKTPMGCHVTCPQRLKVIKINTGN